MKNIILKLTGIISLSLLWSCSGNKEEKNEEVKTPAINFDTLSIGGKLCRIEQISEGNYAFENFESDGTDSLAILKYNNTVSRANDTLILKCDNGTIKKLKNVRSEDDNMEFYNFIGFNKDINAYIISRSLYEGFDVWLINKQTGDSLITIGFPAVSPDKKRFVCTNADLEAAFSDNGIELFENNNNKYNYIGKRDIDNWGPDRAMWKNDTTLIVKALLRADSAGNVKTIYKAIYIK